MAQGHPVVLPKSLLVCMVSCLALTSWAVWVVLCCSSLVWSSAGVLLIRVGDGDGDVGRYSTEMLSLSSLRGQRSMGSTKLILILGSTALK